MLVETTPPIRLQPPCKERQRLRILHDAASARYSTAVNDALISRGKKSKEDYERLRAVVNDARDARNAARLALHQHKREHGC